MRLKLVCLQKLHGFESHTSQIWRGRIIWFCTWLRPKGHRTNLGSNPSFAIMNRKIRRHDGRQIEKIYHPEEFPYERTFWNDWNDYRDGWREWWPKDKTRFRPEGITSRYNEEIKKNNKKIKKQLIRRNLMKNRDMVGLSSW